MNQNKIKALEEVINKDYSNIAGMVVLRDGITLYEKYWNECTPASRIHVYSVTKSIISMLLGIAIDRGYIRDVNQRVLDFFPDYAVRKGEETIEKIRLEDLLTMTAPYRYKLAPYIKYFTSDDWAAFTLNLLGGRGKIGKFRYTPLIGPDILSGILVKATGQSVLDFASENLFTPLGITVSGNVYFHSKEEQLAFNKAKDISGWVTDKTGLNAGGWGLTLSPADMAGLGQLYLDRGYWKGEQLVSSAWIEKSTSEHSRWEKQGLSYGYLWWLPDKKSPSFAAMGDGGNVIYVNTRKRMVVAIASLFKHKAKDRIELIQRYIEPLFEDGI